LLLTMGIGSKQWALSSSESLSAPSPKPVISQWDADFKEAVSNHMPQYDYLWLVAQCKQESWLDPTAVSHADAKGICQFLSGTWNDCQLALGFVGSPFDAGTNIRCAAWYMGGRIDVWSGRARTSMEMLPLAHASYNCGTGCVLKAQRRCANGRLFHQISSCLPLETQEYSPRIERHYYEFFDGS
jgi:membrane-bound lytic murein transglycosylase F